MNIQEAIRSKKKFKLVHHTRWYSNKPDNILQLYPKSLMATDWKVLICEKHNNTTSSGLVNPDWCASCKNKGIVGTISGRFHSKLPNISTLPRTLKERFKKCTCDFNSVILVTGCQCGGT